MPVLKYWDGAAWQSMTIVSTPGALDDIGDVDAAAPDDGDVLTWDDYAGEWVAAAPATGALDDLTDVDAAAPDDGDHLAWDDYAGTWTPVAPPIDASDTGIAVFLVEPTADDQVVIVVPYACTIESVTVLGDAAGSIVVDIWKDTYANYPPTDADTITASAPPTLSSAAASQDATLTGWTTSLAKGDVLLFNVDSASGLAWALVHLQVTRT